MWCAGPDHLWSETIRAKLMLQLTWQIRGAYNRESATSQTKTYEIFPNREIKKIGNSQAIHWRGLILRTLSRKNTLIRKSEKLIRVQAVSKRYSSVSDWVHRAQHKLARKVARLEPLLCVKG